MNNPIPSEYINVLAKKWQKGTITEAEKLEFDDWYNSIDAALEINTNETREEAESRIYQIILSKGKINMARQPGIINFRKWAAAAAVVLITGGGLYYNHRENSSFANDIAPGKNGATLTLANGKKIYLAQLQSGKVANEAGVTISKNKTGEIVYRVIAADATASSALNTLQTLRGEHASVRLPDGTEVFLNASSSLTYPSSFAHLKQRQVELAGEGYFEVAKDKKHPFIVQTDQQTVQVLGTHFNINAYKDEKATKTTLLEGSVEISRLTNTAHTKETIVLKPSQQATLTFNSKIEVKDIDTEETIAWKNNEFLFKTDDFRTVMRKIARWYDIEVIYEPSAPLDLQLGGYSSRARNISAILKMMEKTGEVHFRIEGRRVYVSK